MEGRGGERIEWEGRELNGRIGYGTYIPMYILPD